MKGKWRFWLSLVLSSVLVFASFSVASAYSGESRSAPAASNESDYYFVQLEDQPVATYKGGVQGLQATKVTANEKLNPQSADVKNYRSYLAKKRADYKQWLKQNVKSTRVIQEYSLTLNGLAVKANEAEAKRLAQGPGVKKVVQSKQYRPLMNRSHLIINTMPAWKEGYDGAGIKVAVIDSGIDVNHPYLKDPSLEMPEGFPKAGTDDWLKFTSNKVIVAKVFSPDPVATPEALGSHGTHVAGTIAGKAGYKDPTGLAGGTLSGVAPKAYLGNYNVFPCPDDEPCSAESIHIAAAIEQAVNDGMDIANLSLGGTATPGFDLLVEVVNAASDAGMTMVIAAGNSGPGAMTVESPGIAEKAITVAAVSNNHFFGKSITVTVDGEERVVPVGSSDPGGKVTQKVAAPLAVVSEGNGLGCEPIAADLTGKIAVLKRGSCTFTDKATHAKEKGAVGVILVNNSSGDPTLMSVDASVTIPMVMVTDRDGAWILAGKSGSAVMEPGPDQEFTSTNDSLIAGFSSRGPTIHYTLKPDVAAVGVNVYSSVVGGGLSSYNGTSMATPHVAGAVALLKQAHPDWTPQDFKSALMGTARDPKSAPLPLEVGAGIINVGKALKPVALANPASLSFGKLNKKGAKSEGTIRITLKNTTKKRQSYFVKPDRNITVKHNSLVLTLRPGQTGTIDVAANTLSKSEGDYQGYLQIMSKDGDMIRLPYYYHIGK
ncbi:S8 family serine peptidase [Paenactinomyces guangxiensis]|uniref:S8 family serine peptidase n=1 Tax=Paenactinomyces guangxiensis TaxID=1490290 RepID=A0A7W2A738_9BACL|nr:S8 family serine peptidase [Paenactinomyces guangxiensis]MBA4492722.1 S8 family serine peptidase [Paenactinomyces guangxiensis]MBH8590429.1 S8 family serine peptidase [Paenactinomyces guangxiensis]